MKLRILLLVAISTSIALLPTSSSLAQSAFSITPFTTALHPGEMFTVGGAGCAPVGALSTPVPLYLRLTPPTGGNEWEPAFIGPNVGIVSTQQQVAGEIDLEVVPEPDDSFTASFTIPENAPALDGYTVRGICLTGLEAGDGPNGFTQESFDASFAEAGSLNVIAVEPTTTTTLQTAPTTEPPATTTSPSFTG